MKLPTAIRATPRIPRATTARQKMIATQRMLGVCMLAMLALAIWKATALPGSNVPGLVGRDALVMASMWLSAAWLVMGPGWSLLRLIGSPLIVGGILVRFSWNSPLAVHFVALGLVNFVVAAAILAAVRWLLGSRLQVGAGAPPPLHFSLRGLLFVTALAAFAVSLTRWIPVNASLARLSLAELRQLTGAGSILALLGVVSMVAGLYRFWLGVGCALLLAPLIGALISRDSAVANELVWLCFTSSAIAAGTAAVVRSCAVRLVRCGCSDEASRQLAHEGTSRPAYEA